MHHGLSGLSAYRLNGHRNLGSEISTPPTPFLRYGTFTCRAYGISLGNTSDRSTHAVEQHLEKLMKLEIWGGTQHKAA